MIDEAAPSLRLTEMKVLRDMPLSQLRELALPYPDDPAGVIGLTTAKGTGFVDPKTGDWASFSENSKAAKIYQFIYMLHTGKGAWYIGVLLGVSMLAVPFLVVSGVVMVLRRPKNPRRGLKSAPARTADTLLLVGTEGTSTWGFAADLARQLTAAGKSVHVADMNDVAEDCPLARHLFVLTATYGQGEAPASARHFMSKVKALRGKDMQFAVLGFGDKTFPQFCKFADDTQAALQDLGLREFHEIERINQQNGQTFSAWGKSVGATLGISLKLTHSAERPKTKKVLLADKHMLGEAVQAPVAILRFRMPEGKKLLRHSAGDLLGVIVPGTTVPRFYSLASSQRDGWIEICVRKQNGGLCSSFLTNMARGDKVDVFIKPNPTFRPEKSEAPMILVGAGAGVGPLVGFLRNNRSKRPAHMFYGGRHPKSDFLYESELSVLKLGGNLTQLTTAFSRVAGGGYVQEQLLKAAEDLRAMVQSGAQILVCGGAGMGTGVRESFDLILAPIGQSVDTLRQEKRYLEDVY
jgi:sulfite reductase (NADPH) flavoprotein alpha-component